MNFISYSDCPISINGENFYAKTASLTNSANIKSNRLIDGSLDGYPAGGPIGASGSVSYYVT